MQNGKANGVVSTGVIHTPPPSPEKRAELKKEMRAAATAPPPDPFAFADELPTRIRALVTSAVDAEKKDKGDKRYLEGMRRGAYLLAIAMNGLDSETRGKVMAACTQLEEEIAVAEQKLREATTVATK